MEEFKDRYRILILCICSIIASVGLTNVAGIYTTPVCAELNFTQNAYGISTMLSGLASAFTTLFVPKIVFNFGTKKTILLGAVLNSISMFLKSCASSLYLFYAFDILSGISYSCFSSTVIFMIINNYFGRNIGSATSIVMCFSGLSAALFSPLFAYLIEATSWRMAMRISGVACVLLCIPFLFYKNEIEVVKPRDNRKGIQFNFGSKTYIVLILCAVYAFAHFPVVFSNYLSSYGKTLGLSLTRASLLSSLFMTGNVVGKLVNGYITDHFGALKSNIVLLSINGIASVLFLFVLNPSFLLPVAFLFGSISSITGMGMSLIVKELFGNELYSAVFPLVSLAGVIGYSLWTPIVGAVYDFTGKYTIAIATCVILDVLMIVLLRYVTSKFNSKEV